MQQLLKTIIDILTELTLENGLLVSLVFSSLIIMLESMIPIVPLAVFISLNVIVFGPFTGFLISWIATIIGCMIAFTLVRELLGKKIKKSSKIHKVTEFVDRVSFSALVLTLAIPFTPAFLINIGAGLSEISYKKFFISIVIGKISAVYFWGFVGTNFMSSLTDVSALIKLSVMIIVIYIVSKIINKKFHVEG